MDVVQSTGASHDSRSHVVLTVASPAASSEAAVDVRLVSSLVQCMYGQTVSQLLQSHLTHSHAPPPASLLAVLADIDRHYSASANSSKHPPFAHYSALPTEHRSLHAAHSSAASQQRQPDPQQQQPRTDTKQLHTTAREAHKTEAAARDGSEPQPVDQSAAAVTAEHEVSDAAAGTASSVAASCQPPASAASSARPAARSSRRSVRRSASSSSSSPASSLSLLAQAERLATRAQAVISRANKTR